MQFVLNINVDNAAFGETTGERDSEVADILRDLAAKIFMGHLDHGFYETVRDRNGNDIGRAAFKDAVQVIA